MKELQALLVMTGIVLSTSTAFSQDFDVPKNVTYKTGDDYKPYEKDIIAASKWLEATPLNTQELKHNQAYQFIMKWIDGSPTVTVNIFATIVDMNKKNDGMMVVYMAGCARYVLENNYSKDMQAEEMAGLRSMIKVYKSTKGINKDKQMEKLVKADESGKLEDWMKENMQMDSK